MAAVGGLGGYVVLVVKCGPMGECMELLGYLGPVPIVAYAIMRNLVSLYGRLVVYFMAA